jgi:hypothetical protein
MYPGKLIVVVGLPGSGKSTLVQAIGSSISGLRCEDFHAGPSMIRPLSRTVAPTTPCLNICGRDETVSSRTSHSVIRNGRYSCRKRSRNNWGRPKSSGFIPRTLRRSVGITSFVEVERVWQMISPHLKRSGNSIASPLASRHSQSANLPGHRVRPSNLKTASLKQKPAACAAGFPGFGEGDAQFSRVLACEALWASLWRPCSMRTPSGRSGDDGRRSCAGRFRAGVPRGCC